MTYAGKSIEPARPAQDVDAIPTLAWSARPDGSAEFLNRSWLDYTGLSAEEASDWGWAAAVHTEDRDRLMDFWQRLLASGEAGEIEARLRPETHHVQSILPVWRNEIVRMSLSKLERLYAATMTGRHGVIGSTAVQRIPILLQCILRIPLGCTRLRVMAISRAWMMGIAGGE